MTWTPCLVAMALFIGFVSGAYTVNESLHPKRGISSIRLDNLVIGACIAVIVACMFFVSWVIVR